MNQPFSHTDATGQARMVDVSAKDVTRRVAEASCRVHASLDVGAPATIGEVDQVLAARLAGINAAKQTATLIPLCHPLNLEQVRVEIARTDDGYSVTSSVVSVTRTGVEMEALTACAVAALSLVAALRHVDPSARIDDLVLERKSGGASGEWGRRGAPAG